MKDTAILNTVKNEELNLWNSFVTYYKTFGEDHPMTITARTEWSVMTRLLIKLGDIPLLQGRQFIHLVEEEQNC